MFYPSQPEDYNLGDGLSEEALRMFQRGNGGGQDVCDLGEGVCAHILVEVYCYSKGIDTLVNGFSVFPSMGRCKKLGS